jgi:hypothetical protein
MDPNSPIKSTYTSAEFMKLFIKNPEPRKLTEKQNKISANHGYPALLRIKMKNNEMKK